LKEADTLAGAGYEVSVVSAHCFAWTVPLDDAIERESLWRSESVQHHTNGFTPLLLHYVLRIRNRAFRELFKYTRASLIPELACSPALMEHLSIARRQRADLYIGHNLQSLPVVCRAARTTGALSAFDSEDLHCGEAEDPRAEGSRQALTEFIQKKYLGGCAYVSASSPGIAGELVKRYHIRRPNVVLNTFPLVESGPRHDLPPDRSRRRGPLSFYWFSQIIGLDRGLQDAIVAIGKLESRAELHCRGAVDESVRRQLLTLAEKTGSCDRVFLHPPVPPEQLPACAGQHDVGLCLETQRTVNHDLCISNKLFMYLASGLPIIATRTKGQSDIFAKTPGIGYLYDPGDIPGLVHIMNLLITDPDRLLEKKRAAVRAAKDRWNWSVDADKLLRVVNAAFTDTRRQFAEAGCESS
jgi:glycosyltransferase involved in cell wall biosynthesis